MMMMMIIDTRQVHATLSLVIRHCTFAVVVQVDFAHKGHVEVEQAA